MAAPLGNNFAAKKNRMFGDTLKRELKQRPDDVLTICNKLIEDAKSTIPEIRQEARKTLFERVDGKVPQPIVGDGDEPPVLFARIVRSIVDPQKPAPDADAEPTDR